MSKESSKSDDYYELSFYANKFSIAVNIHGASVVNSTPKTYSDNKTATVVAENYNAILPAIASYLNEGGCYGYMYSFDIECCDGAYTRTAYLPTPLSSPLQIV